MPLRLFLLIIGLYLWLPGQAGASAQSPLEPTQAFKFSARTIDAQTLEARWQIADGYYMYRDKFRFTVEPATAQLGAPDFPPGQLHQDEQFGEVETYRKEVVIRLPLRVPEGLETVTLKASSQGCADMGVCYPPLPQEAQLALRGPLMSLGNAAAGLLDWLNTDQRNHSPAASIPEPMAQDSTTGLDSTISNPAPDAGVDSTQPDLKETTRQASRSQAPRERNDESSRIARLLKDASLGAALLFFFGSGLALAFTPCMFPMIPIISGLIIGHGHHIDRWRAAALSSAYVIGMALVYAIVGIAAGLSGTLVAATLQNAWVLGLGALIFILLALAMFGLYELQMPSFLQSRFRDEANRQQRGSLHGAFWMGAISSAIVGPCVAAPLAGALLYIAHTGDATLGGLALFAMGLGMGLPLILIGASARHWLPKPGPWMTAVNRCFGVLLLAVALWLVNPLLPALLQMLAWAALLILPAMYLHALDPLPADAHGWQRFGKGLGVISLIIGAALLIGALGGSRDPLQPLAFLQNTHAADLATSRPDAPPGFKRIRTLTELESELQQSGPPVLLDFYADWCITCKEMEKRTFADRQVAPLMRRMRLLQVDVTQNTVDDQALLQRFELFGPPGIIFFNAQGQELADLRTIGFVAAEGFQQTLQEALAH